MSSNEFEQQKQSAINRIHQMNAKSTNPPPKPKPTPPPQQNTVLGNLNFDLPFANLFKDKETALILGLLLILYGEKADKMLLLALVYILL